MLHVKKKILVQTLNSTVMQAVKVLIRNIVVIIIVTFSPLENIEGNIFVYVCACYHKSMYIP